MTTCPTDLFVSFSSWSLSFFFVRWVLIYIFHFSTMKIKNYQKSFVSFVFYFLFFIKNETISFHPYFFVELFSIIESSIELTEKGKKKMIWNWILKVIQDSVDWVLLNFFVLCDVLMYNFRFSLFFFFSLLLFLFLTSVCALSAIYFLFFFCNER